MASDAGFEAGRLCTIREIADKSGLGTTTVHRILKDGQRVHPQTREVVIRALRELNAEKIARVLKEEA